MEEVKNTKSLVIKNLLRVLILVVVGIIVITAYSWWQSGDGVIASQYQAVFLQNGEVYFGNITDLSDDKINLENVYYLQVDSSQTQSELLGQQPEPQINLIKLGQELHGPEDKIFIPMTSVIYWENIRDDGQVSIAIQEAIDNPIPDQPQPAATNQTAPAVQSNVEITDSETSDSEVNGTEDNGIDIFDSNSVE